VFPGQFEHLEWSEAGSPVFFFWLPSATLRVSSLVQRRSLEQALGQSQGSRQLSSAVSFFSPSFRYATRVPDPRLPLGILLPLIDLLEGAFFSRWWSVEVEEQA